jgi:hypothetical protein
MVARYGLRLLLAGSWLACWGQSPASGELPVARFGTTVVSSTGFHGQIYYLAPGTAKLPKFEKMRPVGSIYTTALNVPPTEFTQGFPGVTNRFEWFAIDYAGRFWIEKPGKYQFKLMSDDGSKLYVDDHQVINNDGTHPPVAREGRVALKSGVHHIRVSYFQGPRLHVALTLSVAAPGEEWRVFNMDEFLPPSGSWERK